MPANFPSVPLFHSISLSDLTSLLASQSITLTSIDQPAELAAALSTIQNVIAANYPGVSGSLFNTDDYSSLPVYSFSLTSQSDAANLWQNFNPSGGFAIVIDPAQLSSVLGTYNLTLTPCIYDDAAKSGFILDTIVNGPPEELDPNGQMFIEKVKEINRNILNYAGLLKDASRANEQEWRIMANYSWEQLLGGPGDIPPNALSLDVKSVTVNNSTVNGLQAPLTATAAIQQVVVGPHQDMAQAKADCQALLTQYGLTSVTITESVIPYQ